MTANCSAFSALERCVDRSVNYLIRLQVSIAGPIKLMGMANLPPLVPLNRTSAVRLDLRIDPIRDCPSSWMFGAKTPASFFLTRYSSLERRISSSILVDERAFLVYLEKSSPK